MSKIVPFTATAVPAEIINRDRSFDVNKDIVAVAAFPTLSIKGKTFALVQDSERKVLTKPDDPDEVLQHINVAFIRINQHAKTYYKKRFTEDDSEGMRPECFSNDGVTPSPNSPERQHDNCKTCKWNVFGSRIGDDGQSKGKACSDQARVAIVDVANMDKPLLLRVPPASLKPLREEALRPVKARGFQYNEIVYRVGFDKEAPAPKLTFKPVGFLDNDMYEKSKAMFDSDVVRAIVGLEETPDASSAPALDEFDAAIKARDAVAKAAAAPQLEAPAAAAEPPVIAKPTPPKARKAKPPAAPPPAEAKPVVQPVEIDEDSDDLLGDLNRLLGGGTDD